MTTTAKCKVITRHNCTFYDIITERHLNDTCEVVQRFTNIVASILPHNEALVYITGAQEWHIMSLLGDVTSPTTAVHYVRMTCSEHREALTGAPTAHGVHKQEFTVQGGST